MKKIYTGILLACATLGTMSCNDELDTLQHGSISVSQFYKTDGEALQGLAAIYSQIQNNWRLNEFMTTNSLSDDFYTGGGSRGNDTNLEELNEFRVSLDNSRLSGMFSNYYNCIYRCNLLVSNLKESSSETMKRCYAEALVIRAFTYLRLVSYFGEVPLIVEEITDGSYARPSATKAEIYEQIENDLQEAIGMGVLMEKQSKDDKVVNVTKQLAQALLGKAYIYESTFLNTDKWAQARTALSEVINSGKYDLFRGKYNDQFHIQSPYTCESMFEINMVPDGQNFYTYMMTQRLGWRTEMFKKSQLDATNASGLTETATESYGFYSPSRELYKAFVEAEGEDGYRLNQVIITYKQLNAMPLQIDNGKVVYGNAGYFPLKFMPRMSERLKTNCYAMNLVLFRYAEALLLAAEAELPAHGGSQAKVDQYMNLIRERAQIANRPGQYTLNDIIKEKRLELCGEGSRFPDVVRWGIAAEVFKDTGKRIPRLYGLADGSDNTNPSYENVDGYNIEWITTGGNGWQSKYVSLPIPQGELNVNKVITQHEGW